MTAKPITKIRILVDKRIHSYINAYSMRMSPVKHVKSAFIGYNKRGKTIFKEDGVWLDENQVYKSKRS